MRRFNNSIEITRRTLEKKEALILRLNKKPLSEEDINHYAKVFGFDSDEYTKAMNDIILKLEKLLKWMSVRFVIVKMHLIVAGLYNYGITLRIRM